MEDLKAILMIANYAIVLGSFLVGTFMWWRGIIPALYRLGDGLARRQIAILAGSDMANSLEAILVDSKLFKKKNIRKLMTPGDVGAVGNASVFLMYWKDFGEHIEAILHNKADGMPFIVYAPQADGAIPQDKMNRLTNVRNVVVTNLRGRLLSDIVACMITTGR